MIAQPVKEKKPHIKKPLNAFMLFMKQKRADVIKECTLKESAAINQILGKMVRLVFTCKAIVNPPNVIFPFSGMLWTEVSRLSIMKWQERREPSTCRYMGMEAAFIAPVVIFLCADVPWMECEG